MKWYVVPAVALAIGTLAACTEPQKPAQTGSNEGGTLKPQPARLTTSEAYRSGCTWPVSFDERRVGQQDDVVATCTRMSTGKRYTVSFMGLTPSDNRVPEGARLVFEVEAPGLREVVYAAAAREASGAMKFTGMTTGVSVVPGDRSVETRVRLIECRDGNDRRFNCRIVNGALSIAGIP